MSIKKELDALKMATARCTMEWYSVITIASVGIGMSIKKELDALMMTIQ